MSYITASRSFFPHYEHDYLQRNMMRYRCTPAPLAQTGSKYKSLLPQGVCLANLSEKEIDFLGSHLFSSGPVQGPRVENTDMCSTTQVRGKDIFHAHFL